MVRSLVFLSFAFVVLASPVSYSQQDIPPAYVFHPNQNLQVHDLRPRVALSTESSAVLAAALEIILDNPELCCGRKSALEDAVRSADPLSLRDVSAKLEGRHLLNDGRPASITTEFVASDSVNPDQIIAALSKQHALLMVWKSQIYVVYGAIVDERLEYTGQRQYVIHKLLLMDPRFSDKRRESVFDRETDNWKDVHGLLKLSATLPE